MKRALPLTGAEVLAASITSFLALVIVVAYLLDRAGLRFLPAAVLPAALLPATLICRRLTRRAAWQWDDVLAWSALVVAATLWLAWRAAPDFLPLGGGPDITHHLLLVDYLERHWRLVHDPAVEPYLGEMVHYTPGVHLLAALGGAWLRSDGLHVLHQVVSLSVALKVGFVFLIALRLMPAGVPRLPIALLGPLLLLLPRAYVLDAFMHDSFLAQVVSELLAVAMWWALAVWDDAPSLESAGLFALAGCGTFLTWPIWMGPAFVALALVLIFRRHPSFGARLRHGLVATVPPAAMAALYTLGRTGWLRMSATPGAVLRPLTNEYGVWFLALSAAGLVLAILTRRGRATTAMLLGIGLQAAVLYAQARVNGNTSAYMAFKTFYLFPYPMAAVATLPAAIVWQVLARWSPGRVRTARVQAVALAALAWVLLGYCALRIVRPIAATRREKAKLSEPLYRAASWARDHLPAGCVAYMVPHEDTAYWLHLAMLRNPRMSPRSADNRTYSFDETLLRWYEPVGLPWAIADLGALNSDVMSDLDVAERFGTAGIIRRRGPSACADGAPQPPP